VETGRERTLDVLDAVERTADNLGKPLGVEQLLGHLRRVPRTAL
jgi:hypothetical protein